jgi:hypothetical protein
MATKIKLVQGDTKPALIVSLTDENSGDPIAVNGATVRMYFRALGDTTILATLTATLLAGKVLEDGTIDAVTSPYDTPGAGGRVQFNWGSTDLNQAAGDYEGEIEITYSDGTKQTVYDLLKFKLREDF